MVEGLYYTDPIFKGTAASTKQGGRVMTRFPLIYAVFLVIVAANAFAAPTGAADYLQHFSALSKLSVAVADAMPPAEYNFRPDPRR